MALFQARASQGRVERLRMRGMGEVFIGDTKVGEVLFALLGISLCALIEAGDVDEDLAEKVLFNPYVMSLLIEAGADEALVDAIHRGTELGDIKKLAPHSSKETLVGIRSQLAIVIKEREAIFLNDKVHYSFGSRLQ